MNDETAAAVFIGGLVMVALATANSRQRKALVRLASKVDGLNDRINSLEEQMQKKIE